MDPNASSEWPSVNDYVMMQDMLAKIDPRNELDEDTKMDILEQQIANNRARNDHWFKEFERLKAIMARPSATLRIVWSEIEKNDLIVSALEDLSLVSPSSPEMIRDKNFLAQTIVLIWNTGLNLVAQKANRPEDSQNLILLTEGTMTQICNWWEKSHISAQKWADNPTSFLNEASPYLIILRVMSEILDQETFPPFTALKERLRRSVDLQEFVFTSVLLVGRREEKFTDTAIETFFKLVTLNKMLLKRVPPAIKGGLPGVVSGLEQMFESDEATSLGLTFFGALLSTVEFGAFIHEHSDLGFLIARKTWIHYECLAREPAGERDGMLLKRFSLIVGTTNGSKARQDERVRVLLEECDFTALIAKCLFIVGHWCENQDVPESPSQSMWKVTSRSIGHHFQVSQAVPGLFTTRRRPLLKKALLQHQNYLVILDQLRSSNKEYGERCAGVWEALGKLAGLEESTLRAQAVAARRAAAGGIVGCCWYKCVMYRQDSDQVMHWCKGCWKVVYCGYSCKTRDWDEGHNNVCQNGTAKNLLK